MDIEESYSLIREKAFVEGWENPILHRNPA
jgi:hypothetical protein